MCAINAILQGIQKRSGLALTLVPLQQHSHTCLHEHMRAVIAGGAVCAQADRYASVQHAPVHHVHNNMRVLFGVERRAAAS